MKKNGFTIRCRPGLALIASILAGLPSGWAAPPTAPATDPDLQAGFPVKAVHDGPGAFHDGPGIHTLVGNIDDTPDLEIIVSGHGVGPLYAWKANGTLVPGWPRAELPRFSYPALGALQGTPGKLDVIASYYGSSPSVHVAYSGTGAKLPGWPRNGANYVSGPPSTADIDGDGRDEIFVCEEDFAVHMYRYDGTSSVVAGSSTQGCHTPALADLDGDGIPEIITTSDADTLGITLQAYSHTGFSLPGFPVRIGFHSPPDSFPVVGDVDGDGVVEIIVVISEDNFPWRPVAKIIGIDGTLKREIVGEGVLRFSTAPALADLDGDGVPEIIFQADNALNVVRGDGTPLPGWPVVWATDGGTRFSQGNSSPVVGDVDGDWLPDIVVTTHDLGGSTGEVRVYNRNGVSHPRFPKTLPIGGGAVPAIADIDLDGRNEIIVTGMFWNGVADFYDKVWVYDLGGAEHGPVHWGQFGGGPAHRGVYTLHSPGAHNVPPVANAGPDQAIGSRQAVTLDGSGSSDSDGRIVRAAWKQLSGAPVSLSNASTLVARFTAPGLKGGLQETLVFELTVTDDGGATTSDQAVVVVRR